MLSVDEDGYIIGRSEGTGAVSATIEGVGQVAECQVEVVDELPVAGPVALAALVGAIALVGVRVRRRQH